MEYGLLKKTGNCYEINQSLVMQVLMNMQKKLHAYKRLLLT